MPRPASSSSKSWLPILTLAGLVAAGCGSTDAGDEASSEVSGESEAESSGESESESESEDGGVATGDPEGEWCYGDPGPNPDWAFAAIGGEYEMSAAAACPPAFSANTVYMLSIREDTQTIDISTDIGSRTYTWDGDEWDGVCSIDQYEGGVELWVMDDLENGIAVGFSEGGVFEHFQGFIGVPIGCTLRRHQG